MPAPPDADAVARAAATLDGVAHRTPVLTSNWLDERLGARVHLKAEGFQRTGSFKFRGAYNAVSALSEAQRQAGILTCSSGNHAQAVALAGRLHGASTLVLMPEDAPAGKVAATRGHGAEIVTFDRYAEDREELTARWAQSRGLTVVHAYDDAHVIAGQGTTALELLDEAGELDLLVVPVGGGGLISGCAIATAARHPGCRIVGVEPAARPAAREAREAGVPVRVTVAATIADGQQTASVGTRNAQVLATLVDEVVGVEDGAVVDTMRLLFERLKVVVEPSGATALAALLEGAVPVEGRRVGVVLSGGNVDAGRFAALASA